MRVAAMKSIHSGESHLFQTTTFSDLRAHFRRFAYPKERAFTDVVLSAGLVAIVVLYVVMFATLYQWSHYAPLIPPDDGAVPPIGEVMPL